MFLATAGNVVVEKVLANVLIPVVLFNARQRGTMLCGTIGRELAALLSGRIKVAVDGLAGVVLIWCWVGDQINLCVHFGRVLGSGRTQGHSKG